MTDQLTDNEVIAFFDGYKVRYHTDTSTWNRNINSSWPLYTKDGKTTDAVFYESSWDALMPVWYKFRDLKVDIKDGLLAYNFHCANVAKEILDGGPSPSEACKLLAEGIRWYNSTTQNKEQS